MTSNRSKSFSFGIDIVVSFTSRLDWMNFPVKLKYQWHTHYYFLFRVFQLSLADPTTDLFWYNVLFIHTFIRTAELSPCVLYKRTKCMTFDTKHCCQHLDRIFAARFEVFLFCLFVRQCLYVNESLYQSVGTQRDGAMYLCIWNANKKGYRLCSQAFAANRVLNISSEKYFSDDSIMPHFLHYVKTIVI